MTMSEFANHVISVANEHAKGITNLQLQKVMYFALGNYIRENGINDLVREIYTEPFEAWPYGPVIRTEYFRNQRYGRYTIQRDGEYNPQYQEFDDDILKYIEMNVNDLVEESHSHSTWLNNKEDILLHHRIEYSLEDIANDFE